MIAHPVLMIFFLHFQSKDFITNIEKFDTNGECLNEIKIEDVENSFGIDELAMCYFCNLKMDKSVIRTHIRENHSNKPIIFRAIQVKTDLKPSIEDINDVKINKNTNHEILLEEDHMDFSEHSLKTSDTEQYCKVYFQDPEDLKTENDIKDINNLTDYDENKEDYYLCEMQSDDSEEFQNSKRRRKVGSKKLGRPKKIESEKKIRNQLKVSVEEENLEVQCYYCSQNFVKIDIENHMRTIHGLFKSDMFGEKRAYQCSKCDRALTKEPGLDSHICRPKFTPRKKIGKGLEKLNLCELK